MDRHYPPFTAEEWDSVGLICGDPDATVSRILFALDPTIDVIHEAMELQADMIITHHPLFLSGVHSVARDTLGGRVIHEALTHGIALFNAHTNADQANPGVSDALADVLGLTDCVPLVPGAEINQGIGRVGRLTIPMPLSEFAALVAMKLPATAAGTRVAGDPEALITTVAVCGGSGDSLMSVASTLADVYVTSDLKHHKVLDHPREICALIDVPHFASEWPWVVKVAELVAQGLGGTVDCVVSTIRTDPWTTQIASPA